MNASGCSLFHQHTFLEATCTKPKICSECEKSEGELLGHKTDMGWCKRCHKLINESEFIEELNRTINKVNTLTVQIKNHIFPASVNNRMNAHLIIKDVSIDLKNALKNFYDFTSQYQFLDSISLLLEYMIE